MAGRGGCSGARERRGRGLGRPEPHPEVTGGVGSAGGGRTAAYLAAAARSFLARNGDGGGNSRRFRPIPWARRTREARRCWGRARRGSGWRGTAARGDGRGAELGYWEQFTGGRAGREEKEEGKMRWASWRSLGSPGSLLGLKAASRRWPWRSP
jgi:hypothetical protein